MINDHQNEQILEAGTVINDCILLEKKPYLTNLKLTYEGSIDEQPVIAKMLHSTFRDVMIKTDQDHIEKLILFSRSIPGFQYVSRSSLKKLFTHFTLQKVKRGWKMASG